MKFEKLNKYIFYVAIALIAFILTSGLTVSDINLWADCAQKYGAKCALHSGLTFPDVDLWTRLAIGSIFFQTGHILNKDIFSYVPTNPLTIDHEWGTGVVFYFISKYFGYSGLFFLKVILIFLIFILISKVIKLQSKTKDLELVLFLLAGYSIFMIIGTVVRAQLFTYVFFALWLYLLEKIRAGEEKKNLLMWLFPITTLVWVNLHGGFLAGFGLLVIYATGEFLNKKNFASYLKILALCVPVTLINPYGINFWTLFFEQSLSGNAIKIINDWQPFNLFGPFGMYPEIKILMLITLVSTVKLILTKPKINWVKTILIITTFVLTIMSKRHMVLFVICACSFMYDNYIDLFKYLLEVFRKNYGEKVSEYLILGKKVAIFLFISIVSVLSIRMFPSNDIVSFLKYPVGSLEFIKMNKLSGNLSISYDWGSYALWKLYPQNLVSIDGRFTQVYPREVYEKTMNLFLDNNKTQMDYFNTDVILASKYSYTIEDLKKLTDWQPVYEDPVSYVLVPKNRLRNNYISPNPQEMVAWREDLTKHVVLTDKNIFN